MLEAFEDYWQEGLPRVERLVFRPIPESSTRLAAVQTGEVDIAQRFSAEEAATLEQATNVDVLTYPVDRVYYIAFNNLTTGRGTPMEDVRVRQALNYAVDKQAIIDSILDGAGVPATVLVSSSSLGYDPSLEPYPYDPDRARQLLAEAGYPDGFEIGMACPTGAYIQAQIVNLLADLRSRFGLTYLLIAHDLAMVRHISHRIAVMYLGRIVEEASAEDLFRDPLHPYTQALISAMPVPDPERERRRTPIVLRGEPPSPRRIPPGCPFHVRCPIATEVCRRVVPELRTFRPGHRVACHLVDVGTHRILPRPGSGARDGARDRPGASHPARRGSA